jgi:uncharacterized membrane protein YhaH (DUF805 family)
MDIFKLYLSLLKKSFTIRGRASRTEVVIFHVIGLIPITICLLITLPTIHSVMRQSKQLLTHGTGGAISTLSEQPIQLEAFNKILNILSDGPAIEMFQQKLSTITATLHQHLPSLLLLLLSILIYIIPSYSLTVRRLHDINLSGYFYLTQFIPFIGMAIFLILMLIKGTDGPNRYGPNPPRDRCVFSPLQ